MNQREGLFSGLGVSDGGNVENSNIGIRIWDFGKNFSDLGVSAVKPLSTAEAQSLLRRGYAGQGRGGVFHSGGNEAGKIETSAGELK